MNGRMTLIVLFSIIMVRCQSSAVRSSNDTDALVVRRMLTDFDSDAAKGNLDGMMLLFADDVVAFPPGQPQLIGRPALRSLWQQTLEQFEVRVVHDVAEVHNFRDVVVLNGRAHGSFVPKGAGSAVAVDNWFLHIYTRQSDGSLRLWRGGFAPNTSLPPKS